MGKSVNVVRRFADHTWAHQDIAAITFKPIRESLLDKEERHCATQADLGRAIAASGKASQRARASRA